MELQPRSLRPGYFKYDTNIITRIRKQSSFRKFGQEVLCCHTGVFGEIHVITTELEGPVCTWLGLQQQGSQGQMWGVDVSLLTVPAKAAVVWMSPSFALPARGMLMGSSWLANVMQMESRGGSGLKPPCYLGESPSPSHPQQAAQGRAEGCDSCRALSIPTAASVYPINLLRVLLPHHPWHHAGDVLLASPGKTQRLQ